MKSIAKILHDFRNEPWPLGDWREAVAGLVCLALLALMAGCEEHGHHGSSDSAATVQSNASSDTAATAPAIAGAGTGAAASDPLPPGGVSWCYGGFSGSRAQHDGRCRISSLRVSNPSGLSLKWESGIPADWAKDQNGLVIFALFFQAGDGSWKGGKIDWINAARSTRDLKNPASGYNGWNWGEYLAAKKHAAVVVSTDGKKRSNWIFD